MRSFPLMGGLIDLDRWARRDHYRFFLPFEQPYFSVTVEVDVTEPWIAARDGGPSFHLAALFALLHAANGVEAFRLRLRPEGVWLHDRVHLSTTVLRSDGTIGFARLPFALDPETFRTEAEREIRSVRDGRGLPADEVDDLLYQSTLPWLRFTAFSNAMPRRDDSVPRLVFGQCAEVRGRWTMPFAVEVHHAVVDGRDVGLLVEGFQAALKAI